MLKCKEIVEQASEYLDRDLSMWQRLKFRLHLFLCHNCRRYLRQMRSVIRALNNIKQDEPTIDEQQAKDIFHQCKHHRK